MEGHHRDILQRNHQALVKNISDIESVVSELYSKCVLTEYMFEEIMSKPTRTAKIRELLKTLPRRGEEAFNQFYSVLASEDIDEGAAADLLKPDLKEQRKEARRQKVAFGPSGQEGESDEEALPEVWPDGNPADVQLKECKKNHKSMYKKFKFVLENPFNDTIYPMTKQKRGICMIINNDVFSNNILPEREGSGNDSGLLVETFEKLNFEVEFKENITSEEIKNIVKWYSEMNHSEYECFVMVIMSHGCRGHIYGADGKLVGISEITDSFRTCTSLNKKPKLFFVQACQNDEVKAIGDALKNLNISKDQQDSSGDPNILTDYFVAMSTTPGNVSWRSSIFGSWFIQAVIYVLRKFAYRAHITDIMTKVNNLVQKGGGDGRQVSLFHSSFSKNFYFFPGWDTNNIQ